MQTPESISDSVQRTVRSDDTSPTELEDLLPGSVAGDTLPGSAPRIEAIRSELNDAENVAADIELHTRQAIREQISDAAKGVEQIQANLQGHIGNELDASSKVADKLSAKIKSRIANGLTQAYADTVSLGFPVPTMEQVNYGLATGDYLGSMVGNEEAEIVNLKIRPPELPTDCPPGTMPRYIVDKSTDPPTITGTECTPVHTRPPEYDPTQKISVPESLCGKGLAALPDKMWLYVRGQDTSELRGTVAQLNRASPNTWFHSTVATSDPPSSAVQHWLWQDLGNGLQLVSSVHFAGPTPRSVCGVNTTLPAKKIACGCTCYVYDGVITDRAFATPPLAGTYRTAGLPVEVLVTTRSYSDGDPWTGCDLCENEMSRQQTQPPTTTEPPPTTTEPPATTTETCPIPETPTCGTESVVSPRPQQPKLDDYCESIVEFIKSALLSGRDVEKIISAQFNATETKSMAWGIAKAITGKSEPAIPALVNSFGKWLGKTLKEIVKDANCDTLELAQLALFAAGAKFLNQWTGCVPRAVLQTMQQTENMSCQTIMPDQPSTDKAYLADEISKEVWECWTKLNGNVVAAAKKGPNTLRTRPTSEQLAKLLRRKQITQAEFDQRIRMNGVIQDDDKKAIFDLTQDWPSLSDLTPMLVRDVWDETTIDWTEVDKLFDAKYTDETKKYFDAIGLTRDVVKYYWRAHFHLPSFTMASEMYHRFRALPEGDPLRTDLKKVKALLIQDDWHPDWIERMLAITFRPMRLIDIRTAYDMRLLDAEGLRDKLRILGYSDDDVATTERIWERRRDIRDAKQGGFPSIKSLISQYANCEIDEDIFRFVARTTLETQEQVDRAVEAAQLARQSEDYRRTIAGVSWQYRRGLISEQEATAALAQQGIDPSCVPSLVRTWKSQAAKQPKQLAAGSLCKMLEQGVINQSEFVNALIRIGYTSIDADRIMRSCSVGLTQKEIRRANQEASRLAREQKAIEREAAKRRRLEECGPPACPKNRQTPSLNGEVGQ